MGYFCLGNLSEINTEIRNIVDSNDRIYKNPVLNKNNIVDLLNICNRAESIQKILMHIFESAVCRNNTEMYPVEIYHKLFSYYSESELINLDVIKILMKQESSGILPPIYNSISFSNSNKGILLSFYKNALELIINDEDNNYDFANLIQIFDIEIKILDELDWENYQEQINSSKIYLKKHLASALAERIAKMKVDEYDNLSEEANSKEFIELCENALKYDNENKDLLSLKMYFLEQYKEDIENDRSID